MSEKFNLAITAGDINGIGPEVIVKALCKHKFSPQIIFHLIAPEKIISQEIDRLNLSFINNVKVIESGNCNTNVLVSPGHPTQTSGEIAYKSIEMAITLSINNQIDGIVTAPVSKKALMMAGYNYSGHTEIFQKFFPESNAQMLFVSKSLKLLLLTRHIPLNMVSKHINKDLIVNNVRQLQKNLESDFLVSSPKIAICGLNPHSGESGSIGKEEVDSIIPAIKKLQKENINITGPYSADSFWHMASNYDCVIALYHDQGLIPVKMLYRDELVNVTTGLPIIRTSPCHGTAYDIVSLKIAREQSLIHSIELCIEIIKNRKKTI